MAPVPSPGICADKQQFLHKYEIAASDYSRAVQVLAERAGVMSRADYIRIREYSEVARVGAEAARNALDQHIAEHSC